MRLLALEHSKAAYEADFILYGAIVVHLAIFLLLAAPSDQRLVLLALTVAGMAAWTGIEYAFHRYILHGLDPFRRWHAQHHAQPGALICLPTVVSVLLFIVLIFLPALQLGNPWRACAMTLGVLIGFLLYSITHHATHHWRTSTPWLNARKTWHGLHHQAQHPGCYGVTTGIWDHVFGTTKPLAIRPAPDERHTVGGP